MKCNLVEGICSGVEGISELFFFMSDYLWELFPGMTSLLLVVK